MITFNTLQGISLDELTETFNLAFSDYLIPLKLTGEQLQTKMQAENTQLHYSVGAFDNGKLVGFILHAFDTEDNRKKIYNGGTGVIPSHRGNKLTVKMYEFILPILQQNQIDEILLEVISENQQAIKSYEQVGFCLNRKLDCFSGEVNLSPKENNNIIYSDINPIKIINKQSIGEVRPSWQNTINSIERIADKVQLTGAFEDRKLVGYIVFNPTGKRIYQIAVSQNHRRQGIGSTLVHELTKQYGSQWSIINVDQHANSTIDFLKAIGLKHNLTQLELTYQLP